ncbi:hypothetical protein F5Y19DRAFT_103426 [Xylariaceae sp. FL1651]|nr:hypothetical protein F5Y19DRAFT_103426 [Xylariaceae sp. FL1651]
MASDMGTQHVSTFFTLLSSLATDQATAWIDQIIKDNELMKTHIEEQKHGSDAFIRQLSRLDSELQAAVQKSENAVTEMNKAKTEVQGLQDQITAAQKEIANKDVEIQQKSSTIVDLKATLETRAGEVQARDNTIKEHQEQKAKDDDVISKLRGDLESTRAELTQTASDLQEIRDLSYQMNTKSKDDIINELDRVYNKAKMLSMKYFGDDLPEDMLIDTARFEEARQRFDPIPMPASNSTPAKKARIAACMAALGSRMAERIFVPFYIIPNGKLERPRDDIDDIVTMLSNLSTNDPKRELHIRSILLAISPEQQMKVAYARAAEIACEVVDELGILLRPEQHESFENDLHGLCRLAVESWSSLRSLKEKIEPFNTTTEYTEQDWTPAELNLGTLQLANGKQNGDNHANGLTIKSSMHSLKSSKTLAFVWPGFALGSDLLKHGSMLLESQVKAAEEEQPSKRRERALRRASGMGGKRALARKKAIQWSSD